MSDLDNRAVVFCFISTREDDDGNILPYGTQKQLLAKAFQSNKIFENGDLLNTMERRALYPLIHCSTKTMNEIEEIQLLKMNDLGDSFISRQGVYIESKRHIATKHITDQKFKDDIAYIFMGFKSVDLTYNETLEESWKEWTGARVVNTSLRQEFHISRYSFFHRIQPEDPELFMYILLIECHNVKTTNKTYLLDFVQKLRVERVFGYLTVYRRDVLTTTSAIINGILGDQDEYVGKVDM